ncbi:MAG: hypothetical protein ABIO86_06470 [Sphingomonas sp.]
MFLLPALAFLQIAAPGVVAASPPLSKAAESSSSLSCLPVGITKGAKVVALSVYTASSGREMPFLLAGSNNNSVNTLTVTGHADDPVILVVSAYHPILWDLSQVSGRVKAVVASGYYPQAVRGVPADTPIRFSSMVGNFNGSETCARIHYAYDSSTEIQTQAADIKRAIGVYPRIFYGKYSVDRLDLDGPGNRTSDTIDFSDIRTAVPIITEDDPASKARMKMVPTDDGPKLRVIEWNRFGKIIRDEGGPKPAKSSAIAPSAADADYSAPRSGGGGLTLFKWLCYIGVAIFVISQWRRSKRQQRAGQAANAQTPPSAPRPTPPSPAPASRFQKQIAELSELAAVTDCEALVVALHRYGREVQNLSRMTFDSDLGDEIDAIVDRHFDHAIERYRLVRSSLNGVDGARADEMLTRAIERLALRLQELQAEQQHRGLDGVDEAARFIDARHPV